MDEMRHITATILAGGAGTRLRTVVADRPKVLASVGGRPFLTRLLDQLAAQQVTRILLCTGYLGSQVQTQLGDSYQGMELLYSQENTALGTAGAIVQALPLLRSDTVLVLNGDSFCEVDLGASLAWHQQKTARATLVLAHVDQGARYGRVATAPDGQITRFLEKTGSPEGGWINSGIYWFQRSALGGLPARMPLSLERDVFPGWIGQGLYGYAQPGRFLDIGVPEDYLRAERFFSELPADLATLTV